jgi:hypothetical protein
MKTPPSVERVGREKEPGIERRRAERFASDLETACKPVAARGGTAWKCRVVNISRTGIALALNRRFEQGALLSVDLEDASGAVARTMFARVVHVRSQGDDLWMLGCAFAGELNDDELKHFHAERRRAEDADCRAWVRFDCDVPAKAMIIRAGPGESLLVRVVNISPGGMCLLSPCELKEGTCLWLEFPPADGRPAYCLEARAIKVISHGPDGWQVGCEFVAKIKADELKALAGGEPA